MAKPKCTQTHPEFTSRSSLNAGPMLFTFCIASRLARLVDLRRIRTVSTIARTEAEARSLLAGLPLVFQSCRPALEVAA